MTSPIFGYQDAERQNEIVELNRVELRIVDEDSQPIANANVTVEFKTEKEAAGVFDPLIRTARTDADGNVAIDIGRDEVWVLTLHVESVGKTPHRICRGRTGDQFVRFPFQRTIVMKAGQSLTCKIKDHLGNPVAKAVCRLEISPEESLWPGAPDRRFIFGEFVSDDDGNVVVSNVPEEDRLQPLLIVDHPDHFGPIEAADLTDDQVVQFPESATIFGRVTDPTGKPVEFAQVRFGHCVAGTELPGSLTDGDGRFEILGSFPGTTCLTVETDAYAPQMKTVTATLDNPQEVDFQLKTGRNIAGKLVDTTGSPVSDAKVSCIAWHGWNLLKFETSSDHEGQFVWAHAPTEDVEFEVEAEGLLIDRMIISSAQIEPVTLAMWPTFEVSGKILDADFGDPLDEAFGSFGPTTKSGLTRAVHHGKLVGQYRHRFQRVASTHWVQIFLNTHEYFPFQLDYRNGDAVVDVVVSHRDKKSSRHDKWPDLERRIGEGQFDMQQRTALERLHELGAEIRVNEFAGKTITTIRLSGGRQVKYGRDGSETVYDDPEKALWKGGTDDLLLIGEFEGLHLHLTGWRFSKSVFENLAQIGPIDELGLTGTWELEPDECDVLEELKNINGFSINVYGEDSLPQIAVEALSRLPNLEGMVFRGANDIDIVKHAKTLGDFPNLKRLRISTEFGTAIMDDIARIAKLEELDLSGPYRGSDLEKLPNKEGIKSLTVVRCQIKGESMFDLIEKCPNLELINVDLTELNRSTIRLLSQRPSRHLQSLVIPLVSRPLAVQLQKAHPECLIKTKHGRNKQGSPFDIRPSER